LDSTAQPFRATKPRWSSTGERSPVIPNWWGTRAISTALLCIVAAEIDDEEREQTRSRARNPGGFAQGPQLGSDDAGGLEGSDAAGAERMDLLGHLGQTRNDAQPPNPTRARGTPDGQTPPLLLARLSASPTQRKEVVRQTSALTTPQMKRAAFEQQRQTR
jgi:hypothetical protein